MPVKVFASSSHPETAIAVVNTEHNYTAKCPANAFSLNLIVICF